jgi:hypothetical protein
MGRACSMNWVKRNAYRIFVGKPEGKRPLGRQRRRWVDNIPVSQKIVLSVFFLFLYNLTLLPATLLFPPMSLSFSLSLLLFLCLFFSGKKTV